MTSKLPFMPLYVSDYLADTTHLTCEEHGAYLLLLIALWKAGGILPCDDIALARIARLPLPRWKKMRPNVVAFFLVEGAALRHKRVSAEIERSRVLSKARSDSGKKGVAAKRLKNNDQQQAIAIDLLKQNPSKPEASHISHITDITSSSAATTAAREPSPEDGRAALCVSLGKRITDLMGVPTDPRWIGNWSTVQVWLSHGYDPDLDIWPAVSAKVEAIKARGGRMPASLKFFSGIIADHHADRTSGKPHAQANGGVVAFTQVKAGSPEFSAWIEHCRKVGKRTAFLEKQDVITVPSAELSQVLAYGPEPR